MRNIAKWLGVGGAAAVLTFALTGVGHAQEATAAAEAAAGTTAPETAFILNSLLFLVTGMVVMFMAAGFCMLEAGLVRARNAATICLKNISLYAIAGLMFWLVGYNLMYGVEEGGYIGSFMWWVADDSAALAETPDFAGYAAGSDWYFQMVFCATAASIVSGTLAERIKLWPFLIFTTFLTGIIYPVVGSWEWGGGWLDANYGFSDFAGSTLVHSVGGWAALAGALVLGARSGRFGPGGQVNVMPGSSLPLATLGTFILWLGWFGFNGGSQLALGTAADAAAVSNIFINTNNAAAAGIVTAMVLCQLFYRKVDLTIALNGAIGGLVAITAEPLAPSILWAICVGAIGGALVVFTVPILDKLRIDDVVGAIPAHLVCGIWGTMAVPFSNSDATFFGQGVGVAAAAIFVFVVSLVAWLVLKFTVGIRVSEEDEMLGLDKTELGLEAYPEFGRG